MHCVHLNNALDWLNRRALIRFVQYEYYGFERVLFFNGSDASIQQLE
jgi:hypothetical protein